MQLVVRTERTGPPTATAAIEAAAMAVVRLLADERAAPQGEWWPEIQRWHDGRIRKLARRARGAAWDRVQALPGVTVSHLGAEVRAFVPGPMADMPSDLHRLQVSGLDLEDPDRRLSFRADEGWPGVVVALTPEPPMSTGKLAAQAGHAAHLAWQAMDPGRRDRWSRSGFDLAVVRPEGAGWDALSAGAPVQVTDGGFTEIAPGTLTAVALWAGA